MKNNPLEPGIIPALKIFAGIRLIFFVFSIFIQNRFFLDFQSNLLSENYMQSLIVILISIFLLLGFTYSNRLFISTGKFFFPIAIIISTTSILLEQHLFYPSPNIWQPESFFFVLLIFVAWQYNIKIVLGFIIIFLGLEFYLSPGTPNFSGLNRFERVAGADYSIIKNGRIVARFLSSILVGYIVTQLIKSQREQRDILQNTNKILLANTLAKEKLAVSQERIRLSRELHDTLAHSLSGITIQLDAILETWKNIPLKSKRYLEEILKTSNKGLEDTRRAMQNLRSSSVEDFGLLPSIRKLGEELIARNNLKTRILIPNEIKNVTSEVAECFYRVAQESIKNIVKHSQANSVIISITETLEGLEMTIKDDGIGFDQEKILETNLGIRGMEERAKLIDAKITIISDGQSGTSVILSKGSMF